MLRRNVSMSFVVTSMHCGTSSCMSHAYCQPFLSYDLRLMLCISSQFSGSSMTISVIVRTQDNFSCFDAAYAGGHWDVVEYLQSRNMEASGSSFYPTQTWASTCIQIFVTCKCETTEKALWTKSMLFLGTDTADTVLSKIEVSVKPYPEPTRLETICMYMHVIINLKKCPFLFVLRKFNII